MNASGPSAAVLVTCVARRSPPAAPQAHNSESSPGSENRRAPGPPRPPSSMQAALTQRPLSSGSSSSARRSSGSAAAAASRSRRLAVRVAASTARVANKDLLEVAHKAAEAGAKVRARTRGWPPRRAGSRTAACSPSGLVPHGRTASPAAANHACLPPTPAQVVLEAVDKPRSGVQSKGSAADLVTATDVASEAAILSVIQAAFPGHAVLGEEGGVSGALRRGAGGVAASAAGRRGACTLSAARCQQGSGVGKRSRSDVGTCVPSMLPRSRHQQRVPAVLPDPDHAHIVEQAPSPCLFSRNRRHQQRVPVVRGPAGRHHQLCAWLPLLCRLRGLPAPHHARGSHGCARAYGRQLWERQQWGSGPRRQLWGVAAAVRTWRRAGPAPPWLPLLAPPSCGWTALLRRLHCCWPMPATRLTSAHNRRAAAAVVEFAGGPGTWVTRTYTASRNGGAACNGKPIQVGSWREGAGARALAWCSCGRGAQQRACAGRRRGHAGLSVQAPGARGACLLPALISQPPSHPVTHPPRTPPPTLHHPCRPQPSRSARCTRCSARCWSQALATSTTSAGPPTCRRGGAHALACVGRHSAAAAQARARAAQASGLGDSGSSREEARGGPTRPATTPPRLAHSCSSTSLT